MSTRSGPKGRELKKRNTTALTPLRDRKARDALLKSIDVAEARRRLLSVSPRMRRRRTLTPSCDHPRTSDARTTPAHAAARHAQPPETIELTLEQPFGLELNEHHRVFEIDPAGNAHAAGLLKLDRIVSVDGALLGSKAGALSAALDAAKEASQGNGSPDAPSSTGSSSPRLSTGAAKLASPRASPPRQMPPPNTMGASMGSSFGARPNGAVLLVVERPPKSAYKAIVLHECAEGSQESSPAAAPRMAPPGPRTLTAPCFAWWRALPCACCRGPTCEGRPTAVDVPRASTPPPLCALLLATPNRYSEGSTAYRFASPEEASPLRKSSRRSSSGVDGVMSEEGEGEEDESEEEDDDGPDDALEIEAQARRLPSFFPPSPSLSLPSLPPSLSLSLSLPLSPSPSLPPSPTPLLLAAFSGPSLNADDPRTRARSQTQAMARLGLAADVILTFPLNATEEARAPPQ